ncbi:carbon-nitrogen hydrolase family protein [Desulfosporosinus nitroreducens]|uniref:carbon-nitrogen hydrolase family protein n=1 Tax=Desulfosporosinus nitroreducens TaxID=2018668 RepID=UPI00207D062F|nr:carbon-nitrogen hydrolase family protein [Desulfosporosinus nitroreducens]MCO1600708.1 carbon-nitrogen hydrolase family protein [Desulfosporosinus nitroreducens]
MLKIALCQLPVKADKQENLTQAAIMVQEAASAGAQLAVLPEMFNCPYDIHCFRNYAENILSGETVNHLSALARTHGLFLIGGSIPELVGELLYNTSIVFDPKGEIIAKHRKAHLFDVCVKNGIEFTESQVLSAGNTTTIFETPWGKFGVEICYDIRFPELTRKMAKEGALLVIVPAAFNMTTGPAHWELLFRSRALDNQIFMLGTSPARNSEASYVAYGHSIAVNPWGQILAQLDEKPGVLIVDLDFAQIEEYRDALPVWKQRREDLY